MLRSIIDYFYDKIAGARLDHPIYIIPTFDGVKVILLNIILLVIGLSYANNYVLLFNFILFCLFLGSMFYTHFNLSGLKLVSVTSPQIHKGEYRELVLYFTSTNSQGHYFLRPSFKSKLVTIQNPKQTYAISSTNNFSIKILIHGEKRGRESINTIYLETLFPFNFFRCFTFYSVDLRLFVFPEIKSGSNFQKSFVPDLINKESDEFFIREYQTGDSLKRVDWKKLAQTNKWYTRQYVAVNPEPVVFSCDDNASEELLSSLCFSIHEMQTRNIPYGLKLGNKSFVAPGNSPFHLLNCLRELACYDN